MFTFIYYGAQDILTSHAQVKVHCMPEGKQTAYKGKLRHCLKKKLVKVHMYVHAQYTDIQQKYI